jgi:hypothetical protein
LRRLAIRLIFLSSAALLSCPSAPALPLLPFLSYYPPLLFTGMVPKANVANAWQIVADWGLEKIGDYGAFWYETAIASGYYGGYYDTPDDGTAIYTSLTKCDRYSWCSGLRDDNLTMTRESWCVLVLLTRHSLAFSSLTCTLTDRSSHKCASV